MKLFQDRRISGFGSLILRCYSNGGFWNSPDGFETGIKLHNSSSRSVVELKTKRKSVVSWYSCGPTVYDSAHIGHASFYVRQDIIRRIMQDVFSLNVVLAMGLTDIDDKIILRANDTGKEFHEISSHFEKEFIEDMSHLGVLPPKVYTRVSDHITSIISFVQALIDKDMAYATPDGSVYFRLSQYDGYGKLEHNIDSNAIVSSSDIGPSLSNSAKENQRDFALWKGAKEGEPSWPTPWGSGRPGWHIECSTMASGLFGDCLDLHSGGIDLAFPHHENEEAQSCCYHSVNQWVNYWLHFGHLNLKGDMKMSKSLKNTITIREFLQKYTSDQMRMFCLLTKYRNGIEFSEESMNNSLAICKKMLNFFDDCDNYIKGLGACGQIDEASLLKLVNDTEVSIKEALANDFDTPRAMSLLVNVVSTTNSMMQQGSKGDLTFSRSPLAVMAAANFVRKYLSIFGVKMDHKQIQSSEDYDLTNIMDCSISFRSQVRSTALNIPKGKDFQDIRIALLKHCDNYRTQMLDNGISLKDHGEAGTSWNIVKS